MSPNLNQTITEEENQYSFAEIYYLLKKHFKLILIIFLVVSFSSIYYTLIKKPIYRSSSTII